MADEDINIAVTDDGTISEMAALLQFLGFTGEEAAERLASGFNSASQSQTRLEAAAALNTATVSAQYDVFTKMSDVVSRLTTAEAAMATGKEVLNRVTGLLTISQRDGQEVALQYAQASTAEITARAATIEAIQQQGVATEGLSRLQQNLLARAEAQTAAYYEQIAACSAYTIAQRNAQTEAAQAAISAREYAASAAGIAEALELATARAAAFAASQLTVVEATQGFNIAEKETTALLQAFGVNAAEAATRVSVGFSEANTVIGLTSGQFAILSEAAAGGYKNIDELYGAFNLLSEGELKALSETAQLGIAIDALAASAKTAQSVFALEAETLASETGTFSAAANAKDALAAATARLADIEAADAAAIADEVKALGGFQGLLASATVGLEGFVSAEAQAAAESTIFAERMAAVTAAGKEINATFGGMNAIFAAAFTGAALIKADDTFQRIRASLQTVTTGTEQFNAVYQALSVVANSTQTSLDANVKTFVQLKTATSDLNIANSTLIQAVGGLDAALKLGNVTGQDAYRVMRSFTEALTTTDGAATRFAQNLRRESPAAFGLLSTAAQQLGYNLDSVFGKTSDYGNKIAGLNAKLDEQRAKQDGVGGSVQSYQSKLNGLNNTMSQSLTKIQTLSEEHFKSADAAAKAKIEISKLNTEYINSSLQLGKTESALRSAKLRQDDATSAAIANTQAQISQAQAAQNNTDRQQKLIEILVQVNKTNGEAAAQFTTVSGTLEVLKNNIVSFAGSSNTANASMTLLKDTILLVANNLNVIVPAVIAFGAAIAAVKVAQLVVDIYNLGKALALLALNPFVVTVVAVTAAVVGAAYAFSKFIEVITFGQVKLIDFQGVMNGVEIIAGQVGDVFGKVSKTLVDHAVTVSSTYTAYDILNSKQGAQTKTAAQNSQQLSVLNGTYREHINALGSTNTATDQLSNTVQANTQFVAVSSDTLQKNYKAQLDVYNQQVASKKAQDDLNASVAAAPSLWEKLTTAITNAISALVNYISTAAQAAASAVKSLVGGGTTTAKAPAVAGRAREGGTFHIAGSGPVDSKLIAVSPGEIVTVQTPAQFKAGAMPAFRAAQTHFAVGGVTAGAGVNLGSSVSLASSLDGGLGGVTGFSDSRSSAVGTLTTSLNDNVKTTAADTAATATNTSATAADTSATTANTQAVTANSASMVQLVSSNSQLGNTFSNGTASSVQAANTNTQALGAQTGAANDNSKLLDSNSSALANNTNAENTASENTVNAANGVVQACNSLGQTMASAANSIVQAANSIIAAASQIASAAQSATSNVQTPVYSSSNFSSSNSTSNSGKADSNGIYGEDSSSYGKATTRTVTASQAAANKQLTTPKQPQSTGMAYSGKSNLNPVFDANGVFTGGYTGYDRYGAKVTVGGVSSSSATFYSPDQANSSTSINSSETRTINGNDETNGHFRDGGDLYVPGGSGVDSQLLKLAVSPGEMVSVRTPSQQNNVGTNDSLTQHINMTVVTNDANSFAQSQGQLSDKLVRGLRRAGRRKVS